MRVFRATFKDKDGTLHRAPKWYVEFRGPDGGIRRISAYVDKGASRELGNKLESLSAICEVHQPPSGDLLLWIEGLSPQMRRRLLGWGLLDATREAGASPLIKLVEEFSAALPTP